MDPPRSAIGFASRLRWLFELVGLDPRVALVALRGEAFVFSAAWGGRV